MRRRLSVSVVLVTSARVACVLVASLLVASALLASLLLASGGPAAASTDPSQPPTVTVAVGPPRTATALGRSFDVSTRIVNPGPSPTQPAIAHLNVASLTADVYVDPEDWSSARTRPVPALPPGGSTTLIWHLQAVNAGSFDVYVVVLPDGPDTTGLGPLAVGGPSHVLVADRQTISAGGVLPVVAGVPVALAAGAVALSLRRRRRDQPTDAG